MLLNLDSSRIIYLFTLLYLMAAQYNADPGDLREIDK